MRLLCKTLMLLLPLPCLVLAQQEWEVGGSAGYGLYHNVHIPNADGTTGFTPGVAFGGVFGNNATKRIAGEVRYTYRLGDLKVSSGSTEAKASGESHAIHYDVLLHATSKESSVRPFLAAGAGVKVFRGTGAEPAFQPLSNLIVLTHTTQAEPLLSFGGGIKIPVSRGVQMRLDFRDYASPVPDALLASPTGTKVTGWLHDFVFLIGVSKVF